MFGFVMEGFFFFQAEDGIRDRSPSRGLGDVYKRQPPGRSLRGSRRRTGRALPSRPSRGRRRICPRGWACEPSGLLVESRAGRAGRTGGWLPPPAFVVPMNLSPSDGRVKVMPPPRRTASRGRAARQDSLRHHNLALTLRQVLDAPSPVSRADIAAATGLTRATVSALVDRLLEARLVAELEPVASQRAGRPAVPLAAARGTVAAVGMEVNVDYLGVRAIDLG